MSRRRSVLGTVYLLVGVLVALLVAAVAAGAVARLTVAAAERELTGTVLPARQAAADLTKAYVDQETGQRGFLLTGAEESLQPYDAGRAAAARLHDRLRRLLADDPQSLRLLADVATAADAWHAQADPEVADRRQGPLPQDRLATTALTGKTLFDTLRRRLAALDGRTAELTAAQIDRIGAAQGRADVVALVAVGLAVVVAGASMPLMRRLLTRPLGRLLHQVQEVADGAYEQPIEPRGPLELALIGGAVDRMRAGAVRHSAELVSAQRELTLREEHDRMATELHDVTIQRVFALGLALTSLARRNPEVANSVQPLIKETDQIVREVRTVIFDLGRTEGTESLRGQVIDLAEESVRALGFTPTLEFTGPVDAVATHELSVELLAVLREALSNVARHAGAGWAEIRVAAEDGHVLLTVTDDGVGMSADAATGYGLANLHGRAARLGGTAAVHTGPGGTGTVVEWRVPVAAPSVPTP